jgi:hypothetical protein
MTSNVEVKNYNAQQAHVHRRRKASSRPLSDFESGVLRVPKSDWGHRLCTDFHQLNKFSAKTKFQMKGAQEVAEMTQQGDCGILVDASPVASEASLLSLPQGTGEMLVEGGRLRDVGSPQGVVR